MSRLFYLIFIFSIILLNSSIYGNIQKYNFKLDKNPLISISYSETNEINKDLKKKLNDTATESENPFRRFEIAYFISLPFAFIVNFITLQVYEEAKNRITQEDKTISIWKDHKNLLIGSTLTIPALIATYEAFIAPHFHEKDNAENYGELSLYFSFSKNY